MLTRPTQEAPYERIQEIKEFIKGRTLVGGFESLRCYRALKAWGVLPFSGGYLDQPAWVLGDFTMISMLEELSRLQEDMPQVKASDLKGLEGL